MHAYTHTETYAEPRKNTSTRNICKTCTTNYTKTIPQSILKLPRDQKSKHEPTNETRGAALQPKVDPNGGPFISPCEQPTEPGRWGRVGSGFRGNPLPWIGVFI